ncbi:hypothetical protein CGRA01v4_02355 [Colletotrichum graminicola]|nr:hypothetical protein CGRA01v4_02355 [Colletotrichum graminicola]
MGRSLVVAITGYPLAIPNKTWSLRPLTEDPQDPCYPVGGTSLVLAVYPLGSDSGYAQVLPSNIDAAFVSLTPRLFHSRPWSAQLLRVRQSNASPVIDQKLHSSGHEFLRWSAKFNTLIRNGKQLASARQPSRMVSLSASSTI